jgi:O-acetylserine/cysteine efflux transporter
VTGAEMLSLVAWLSLVPPLPSLALSLALDGPRPPSSSASASGSSGWPGWCW